MTWFAAACRLVPLALLVLGGCAARAPRIPGPLDHLGRAPPPVAPLPVAAEHGAGEEDLAARARRRLDGFAEDVIDAARHYLEVRPKGFRDDCSGYVMAVFARAGLPLEGSTASLYEWARAQGMVHHRKVPRPGDLAFFDDTYDRNENGRLDDELSHIAVVLDVARDGTIVLAHSGTSKGRTTMHMNLHAPDVHEDEDGDLLNDWLRAEKDSDPARAGHLSGELWRAFATVDQGALSGDGEEPFSPRRTASGRRRP